MNMFWSLFLSLLVIVIVGLIAYNKWYDLSGLLKVLRNPHLSEEGRCTTDGYGKEINKKSIQIEIVRNAIGLFVASAVIVFCIAVIFVTIRNA